MARPEVTGKASGTVDDAAVYTIPEFCAAHRISEAFYYKLRNLGLGPREMHAGKRRLVTFEAAADWRRSREVASTESETA